MRTSRWIALGALIAGASCMPSIRRLSAFSSRFPDNDRTHIQAVYARLPSSPQPAARPANALGVPLVAGVIQGEQRRVALFDMQRGRQLWTAQVNVSSAPEILGDLVVVGTGSTVTGLDLRTGQVRWTLETRQMPFMGAAREGDTVVLTMSLGTQGGATRAGRVVAVDAQSGGVRWAHEIVGIVGRPAAAGGFAFVPWDRQSIAVLDLASGVERARVRATDDVISWVFATSQGLYYGSRGAYRWTPRSASGTRNGSAYLANPLENVPGDPPLFRDAFGQTTGARTARDKIRFAFRPRPTDGERMAVEHDTIYLAYYRYIIAVAVDTGQVRWARAIGPDESAGADSPAAGDLSAFDVEGMTVTNNALIVINADGRLRALDPSTGAITGSANVGAQLGAIVMDLDGYTPPNTGAQPAPEGPVSNQLVELIRDPDNRLVPMRAYLVRLLALRPEPEVTRDLLELYRMRSIPTIMRQEIATALRARRNGAQFLIQALDGEDDHYNYLENRSAPPLDVIAPTLASMGAREAVPVLMQHLLDHETPLAALPAIIDAIAQLGDASVIPQLQAFVQRYKSDSAFAGDSNVPLQTAAAAIFRLGDAQAREWLTSLSADTSAHAPLRESITRLFQQEREGQGRQTQEQQLAQAREELQGRINAWEALRQNYPRSLSNDAFDAEWANLTDPLRACAQAAVARNPQLNQIRITVTVRSEPGDLFERPAPPSLAANASFERQMEAIRQYQQAIEQAINRIQAFRSSVRTTAFSPQDPELVRCMDAVIQPVRFAGFGRNVPQNQTFQRVISTVRSQAQQNWPPGFGTPQGSNYLVPWFLVSSPSFDASTGRLNPLAAGSPAGASTPPAGGSSGASVTTNSGTADAGAPDRGASSASTTTPDAGVPTTQPGSRPWWE